jgi:hypothetical protein
MASTARFWPISLLIDVDSDTRSVPAHALGPRGSVDPRHRTIFHETVHYLQFLSHAFLIRVAAEDWQRLCVYEQDGDILPPGPIRTELDRRELEFDVSARDLHECLARFWDVVAVGARRVLDTEWQSGRALVLEDFKEVVRRQRAETDTPAEAWGPEDLGIAMLMVAGEYATP